MRVLVIGINYSPERTGVAPYTEGFASALASDGHEVTVLTTFPHYPEWSFGPERPPWRSSGQVDGVTVTRLRHLLPWSGSAAARLVSELSFGLRALFTRWRSPDVVVLVSPALFATGLAMVRARRLRGAHVGVWVQDLYSLAVSETGMADGASASARFVRAVERWVLQSADSVALIHEYFSESLAGLGIRTKAQSVIRNWSHIPLQQAGDRAEARRRRGWHEDEIVALHTGNMGVKQALGNVVEAARLADGEGGGVRFVLMGDGSERHALEHAARGVRSVDFVDPLPSQQEYADSLAAADVLVVNERSDLRAMALPSKLTSYFASGRPVVAATSGSSLTAMEISSAAAGVLVEPGDPRALLSAVERLYEDTALSDDLGRSGLDYLSHHLTESAGRAAILAWVRGLGRPGNAGFRNRGHLAA